MPLFLYRASGRRKPLRRGSEFTYDPSSVPQIKIYSYCSIHFDGLSVKEKRLVSPLKNCFFSRRHQHRIAGCDFQYLDRAVGQYQHMKLYRSLNAFRLCFRGINRIHDLNSLRCKPRKEEGRFGV